MTRHGKKVLVKVSLKFYVFVFLNSSGFGLKQSKCLFYEKLDKTFAFFRSLFLLCSVHIFPRWKLFGQQWFFFLEPKQFLWLVFSDLKDVIWSKQIFLLHIFFWGLVRLQDQEKHICLELEGCGQNFFCSP